MHVPDHVITEPTVLVTSAAIAVAATTTALAKGRHRLSGQRVAQAGATAGLIFALQMVNFPIGHGVSGHLVGGALAATLLGPWLGMLAVTAVVISQCLFFNDGGLASLGVNLTAMAVVGVLAGHGINTALVGRMPRPAAWGLAAFGSLVLASWVTSAAVVIGSHVAGGTFVGAMLSTHLVIGLGEAVITVGVVALLTWARGWEVSAASRRWVPALGVTAMALAVVALLSPIASAAPDGLEASLTRVGVALTSAAANLPSPTNNYLLVGVGSPAMAGILAGMIGVMLSLGVVTAALQPIRPRERV